MERYGRASEGSQSDPSPEWTVAADADAGLEESSWQLGLPGAESYPMRPDEADCIYYLRTGFCGYGTRCRFNHPRDRAAVIGAAPRTGGEFPERVGQPVCQMKTAVMILRNLEALEHIIKAGWRISKFFCFVHVTQTYLIAPAVIYGPSMLPTIDLKTAVFLMEKISPWFGKVACGDIVVLRNPQDPRRFMTKRVVGLEGDSITYISNPETYELEGDSFTHISSLDNSDKSKTILVHTISYKI